MSDQKLIKKYLEGDEGALEELLRNNLQNIFWACFRVCLDESDAHDITQNVCLKIIKNLPKFQFKSEFKTWAYRISYNESITYIKKKRWYIEISEVENFIPDDTEYYHWLDTKKKTQDITNEINKLPLIDRNILLYYYYDELKIKEISKIMNINENSIKTRLSRAKKKLKPNLEQYENNN